MKSLLGKAFMVEGIILALLGIIFLINPVDAFLSFTKICGFFIIIAAVLRIIGGFVSYSKLYYILTGFIDLLFGILVWRNPVVTVENLILIYGIWTFVKGMYNVVVISKYKLFGFNLLTILSIASILLGGFITLCPIVISVTLKYIPYAIGIYFVLIAIFEMYIGYKIKKINI